jgi:hypothetical protein
MIAKLCCRFNNLFKEDSNNVPIFQVHLSSFIIGITHARSFFDSDEFQQEGGRFSCLELWHEERGHISHWYPMEIEKGNCFYQQHI